MLVNCLLPVKMCEIEENRRSSLSFKTQKQPFPNYWSKNRFIKIFTKAIYTIGLQILNCIISFLECLIFIFKKMSTKCEHRVKTKDKEIQTNHPHQDLTELLTHHFGLLHEKQYINKIIQKSQWNNLMGEINHIKDQFKTSNFNFQEDVLCNLTSLRKEVDSLKHMVSKISVNIDRISVCSPTTSTSNIPLPPPLPPPGFVLLGTVSDQASNTSISGKSIFGETSPPRPIITVESLRQVKLKKTPVLSKTNENSDEVVNNIQRIKLRQSNSCRKRPKTTDSSKTMAKDRSSSSSPRPLTSQT